MNKNPHQGRKIVNAYKNAIFVHKIKSMGKLSPLTLAYNSNGIDCIHGLAVSYTYDATGRKLTVTHTKASKTHTMDYIGNHIYEDGVLKQTLFDGGYVTYNANTPAYHFYVKDHLGNNRMVLSASGAVEQVTHYYPYGLPFSTSTNSDLQPYKYNGKELDTKDQLNWMDYGARMYDPSLARWTSVDALAEKNNSQSPYSYCVGNPIRYIDPCGLDTFNISDNKRIERTKGGKNDVFMFEDKQVASIKGNSTTLRHVPNANHPDKIGYDILQIADRQDAEKVFKGIADKSGNEWSLIETGEYGKGYVSTSYNENEESAGGYLYENANKFNISKVWRHIHSHPFISYSSSSFPSGSDVDFVKHYMNIPSFAKTKYYVYRPLTLDFLQYHHNTNIYSYTNNNFLKLWIK